MLRMYSVQAQDGQGGGGAALPVPPSQQGAGASAMRMDGGGGGGRAAPPPVQLSAAARALIGEDAAVGLAAAGSRPVERGFALDEKMRSTDVDGFLQHHHDGVVLKAVKEAIFAAEANSSEHQRRREQAQWRRERREIVESLDATFGAGPSRNRNHGRRQLTSNPAPPQLTNGSAQQQLTAATSVPAGFALSGGSGGGGGALALTTDSASSSSSSSSVMTAAMRSYALTVRRINEAHFMAAGQQGNSMLYPVIALEECAAASQGATGSGQDVSGHKELMMCWGLLRGAVGEYPEGEHAGGSARPPAPGKFMAFLLPANSPEQKRCAAVLADQSRHALEVFNETFLFEDARLKRQQLGQAHGAVASEPGLVASVAFLTREGGVGGVGVGGVGGG
eukprot:CAMPEP_0171814006 /NCGR_PEP_ID=MMETSP0991-20121206/79514_1 /TAXON_ID=483369 /ORGANISM="non described non described, Strain CCMP2098" /LENGTH=392 /DNA_ID=CAMNT_0012427617 /DNA_START=1 /DNA_END=1177 /DNA_ORIENTATION=+